MDFASTDQAGTVLPLSERLGPLPLYLESDGFYSVLGPSLSHATYEEDQVNGSANNPVAYRPSAVSIPATLTPSKDKVFCGSSKRPGNSGPHMCSRSSYTCSAPNCTRPTPFKTRQALNRHYEVVHLAERLDCPVPGCENVGEKGIKRYDNLVAHMRNKHGAPSATRLGVE